MFDSFAIYCNYIIFYDYSNFDCRKGLIVVVQFDFGRLEECTGAVDTRHTDTHRGRVIRAHILRCN